MLFSIIVFVTMLSTVHVQAQAQNDQARQARHSRYMENAEVQHLADSITITANDARPLAQAVTALSEEYGWAIDFEDPPYYSKYDLVDDTARNGESPTQAQSKRRPGTVWTADGDGLGGSG